MLDLDEFNGVVKVNALWDVKLVGLHEGDDVVVVNALLCCLEPIRLRDLCDRRGTLILK